MRTTRLEPLEPLEVYNFIAGDWWIRHSLVLLLDIRAGESASRTLKTIAFSRRPISGWRSLSSLSKSISPLSPVQEQFSSGFQPLPPRVVVFFDDSSDSVELLESSAHTTQSTLSQLAATIQTRRPTRHCFIRGGFRSFESSFPFLCHGLEDEVGETAVLAIARNLPNIVVPNSLFLGGLESALDDSVVRLLGVTHDVSLAGEVFSMERRWPSVKRLSCDTVDSPGFKISSKFPEIFDFLRTAMDAGGRVLIRCAMGVSRSATVVIGWLMQSQKLSLKQAFDHVSQCRPQVDPNIGFMRQLLCLEESLCHPSFPSVSLPPKLPEEDSDDEADDEAEDPS